MSAEEEVQLSRYLAGFQAGVDAGFLQGQRDVERRISETRSAGYAEGRAGAAAFYRIDEAEAGQRANRALWAGLFMGAVFGVAFHKEIAHALRGPRADVDDQGDVITYDRSVIEEVAGDGAVSDVRA